MPASPQFPTPWPWTTARDAPVDAGSGFEMILEAQTRLWNHLLDANRSAWAFYAPWLQPAAWRWPDGAGADVGSEPATTADGIPDAMELQARSWNRYLEAQRTFWTAATWPVPATPWAMPTAAGEATATPRDTPPGTVPAPSTGERPAARKTATRRARR